MNRLCYALMLLPIALSGCGRTHTASKTAVEKNTPILKIAVFSDGRFTVDGEPSSIEKLRDSLRTLGEKQGVVWYFRESGQQEPPPIAMEILREIMAARIPIRLSSKPDYSDSISP